MKKTWKRLCTGFLAFATVVTALPTIPVHAESKQYWTEGLYLTQITEDGDLAVLSGSNQFSVSDKVIRGGVKIQKRDLETGDTKPQGSATLKDTAFDIMLFCELCLLFNRFHVVCTVSLINLFQHFQGRCYLPLYPTQCTV